MQKDKKRCLHFRSRVPSCIWPRIGSLGYCPALFCTKL